MLQNLPIGGIIQFVTAIAALAVVGLLWKNRKSTEVKYLILVEVSVAVWAICYGAEFSTPAFEQKVFWSQLSYLGIGFIPMSYFFFTLTFRLKKYDVQLSKLILAASLPVVTILLALTSKNHHLLWEKVTLPTGSNMLHYKHGWWFWVFYAYTFTLIFWGFFNLIKAYFEFNKIYRSQVILLFLASVIPVVGNIAYITGYNPLPGFDWTTSFFVLTGLIIAIGVYRHRMFEIVPLATLQLFNILKEAIVVVNKDGLIADANPAAFKIFGWKDRNVFQSPFAIVFARYNNIIEALEKDAENNVDIEIKKDNVNNYYQARISIVRNNKGQINGKLLIVNDVTSIRKSEFELRGKNKQLLREIEKNERLISDLDAFAHTVAHDLKNMLGAIYSSSEALIESLKEGDTDFMEKTSILVKESAVKTIQITDDLMKLATTEYEEVQKERIDMGNIVEQAKTQLSDLFRQYDATIKLEGEWLPTVAYGPWLEEVWINFISNAIKYGGRPPLITVGCEQLEKGKIKYWINDNGDGLSPEYHKKVFEKHTRFHPNKAFGYGLGLSIVKRIIEKMGGKVGVDSTCEPGKGTEFYFILSGSD